MGQRINHYERDFYWINPQSVVIPKGKSDPLEKVVFLIDFGIRRLSSSFLCPATSQRLIIDGWANPHLGSWIFSFLMAFGAQVVVRRCNVWPLLRFSFINL